MCLRFLLGPCVLTAIVTSPGVVAAEGRAQSVVSHPLFADGDSARLGPVAGEMVALELAGRGSRRVIPSSVPCPDPACGARDARALGADTALVGKIHLLGGKFTLTVYWVRADDTVLATAMATANDESGLPEAARRLADDLSRAPAPSTPPPPAYSQPPALADEPSQGSAPVLRIGYFHPISKAFPPTESLSGEASVLFLRGPLMIEPRVGLRRSFDRDGEWFAEVPVDLGLYVRFGQGDIFPFAGGAIGVHYLTIQRVASYTLGSVIYAHHRSDEDESVLGFGGLGRVGVGFRTSPRSMLFVTADVDVTTGEVFGESIHVGTALNLGFGFGG
jgi:hypothetical protein